MESNIIQKINNLLVDEFEVNEASITPDASLKETLDLDSLDYIDLMALTESNFGCKVGPDDFNNIITFQDFYDHIAAHSEIKESIWRKPGRESLREPRSVTKYLLGVQICTEHGGCTISDFKPLLTNEEAPTGVAAPEVKGLFFFFFK